MKSFYTNTILGISAIVVLVVWAVSYWHPIQLYYRGEKRLLIEFVAMRGEFYIGSGRYGAGYFSLLLVVFVLGFAPLIAGIRYIRRRPRRGFEVREIKGPKH